MLTSHQKSYRESLRDRMQLSFESKLKEVKKMINDLIEGGRESFDIQVSRCIADVLMKQYEGRATCKIQGDPNRPYVTLRFEFCNDPVRLEKQKIDQDIAQAIEAGRFDLCAVVRRPLPITGDEFREQIALEYPWLKVELREPVVDNGREFTSLYISFRG